MSTPRTVRTAPDGTAAPEAAPPGRSLPRRPVVTGLVASLLVALASVGGGSVPRTDPLLESLGLAWLRFGHGQQLATAVLYVGVALLLGAWTAVGRSVLAGAATTRDVLRTAALWTAPLLLAVPLYSRDVYSYLAQGALVRDGFDPYVVGPAADPGVLLDNVSLQWTTTPAPYGPLFLALAHLATSLAGDHVVLGTWLLRLAFLPGLALLAWAVPRLAAHLGARPVTATWLVVANPLVLVHLVGGAHNDLLMVGLMAAGVLLALDGRPAAGVLVITLGVAVKATAGLALPFVVWIWFARARARRRADGAVAGSEGALTDFGAVVAKALVLFAVPFELMTLATGVGYGWLGALAGSNKIINWLSVPTAVAQLLGPATSWATGVRSDGLLAVLRPAFAVVLAVLVVLVWWRSRHRPASAVRGLTLSLVLVVLLSPAALPWYYTWPLVLAAPACRSPRAVAGVAAVSAWLLLVFRPPGNPGLYNVLDLAISLGAGYLVWRALTRAAATVSEPV